MRTLLLTSLFTIVIGAEPAWIAVAEAHRGLIAPDQPVIFSVTPPADSPTNTTLQWTVATLAGEQVGTGSQAFTTTAEQMLTIAPALARGWYQIRFAAGDTTFDRSVVVLPERAIATAPATTRMGLCLNGLPDRIRDDATHAQVAADYRAMARLGVGMARGLDLWHLAQRVKPPADWRTVPIAWEHADLQLELREAVGIRTLGTLFYSTGWASGQKEWWGQSFHPPTDLTPQGPYAHWITANVQRYAGRVTHWEHWNEQDSQGFFKGSPEQYARMLDTAYAAVKQADPQATMLSGSWVGTGQMNQRKALDASPERNHDDLCLHGYMNILRKILPVKREYRRRGLSTDPIWVTETGLEPNMNEDWDRERRLAAYRRQATQVVRAYHKYLLAGADHVFWFCWSWNPYGLVSDRGPRPAAATYRLLADTIDVPATFAGYVDCGAAARSVFAAAWRQPDGIAVIGWRDWEDPIPAGGWAVRSVDLPIDAGATAILFALDGREQRRLVGPGVLTMPLDEEPAFVRITGSTTQVDALLGWTPRYAGEVVASVTFDERGQITHGMHVDMNGEPAVIGDRRCLLICRDPEQKPYNARWYASMHLNDDVIIEVCDDFGVPKEPLGVRITYWDEGGEPFGFHHGAFSTPTIARGNSRTWKTVTVPIRDGGLPDQDSHASFRITNWGWNPKQKPLALAAIELIRLGE